MSFKTLSNLEPGSLLGRGHQAYKRPVLDRIMTASWKDDCR